jgi:hypothetical protein
MANEPGAAVLAIFNQLIDRVKQRNPLNTDGRPINSRVYSQLVLGMPIWPDDYQRPWSPIGGASLRQAFPNGAPVPDGSGGGNTPALRLAMQAAWKTAMLCRTMLRVTKDDAYREYPTGRHLDFAYETLVRGMQPGEQPAIAADVQRRIDAANRVLYQFDAQGNLTLDQTPRHKRYWDNAEKLADAKADYDTAMRKAQLEGDEGWATGGSRVWQTKVDRARNTLIGEGGREIEAALAVLGSVGQPIQNHLIQRAIAEYDTWNLGLAGVPANIPYSLILPTNWCDPNDHNGFERLQVTQSEYQHYYNFHEASGSAGSWERHANSSGGSGGITLGFMAFGGSTSSADWGGSWQNSSHSTFSNGFANSAKDLRIDMEYGLCTIVRPWLISDLFYMKNWYLVGEDKHAISDGTIDGQVDSQDKLLPMIPQQFLVVRNVSISSTDWGEDGGRLESYFGNAQGSNQGGQTTTSGGGGVCLGFVNFGGSASTSNSQESGQSSAWQARSGSGHYGTRFSNGTLTMPGVQIVAFLSDIVPACPETDAPAE